MRPIVICGKMCAGKTTAMDIIRKKYPVHKLSFANWMKRTIVNHYDLVRLDKAAIINGRTMRSTLIEFGNMLRQFDKNWHIDELCNHIIDEHIFEFIIDDCRYVNEAAEMEDRFNVVLIKIESDVNERRHRSKQRDGIVPSDEEMSSEDEVDDIKCDYTIVNNGSMDDFVASVHAVMEDIYAKAI